MDGASFCDNNGIEPEGVSVVPEDCDYSGLKLDIQIRLKAMMVQMGTLIEGLENENRCMLKEYEEISGQFNAIESMASSFYLSCYLASFTNRYHELALSVRHLSARRHGALAVIERNDSVESLVTPGIRIDADLTHSLLESIFIPGSPLHDGATIIRRDKIVSAASILPLSMIEPGKEKEGTRHRAARGLSEKCDALVIVVSEETGKSSFARNGRLYPFAANGPIEG
jgi:diadenylate cyclase